MSVPVGFSTAARAALFLPLLCIAANAASAGAEQAVVDNDTAPIPTSPVLGNPRGDVVVMEFFDYACSYCKAVEPRPPWHRSSKASTGSSTRPSWHTRGRGRRP